MGSLLDLWLNMRVSFFSLLFIGLISCALGLECPEYDVNILDPTDTLPYYQDIPGWEECGLLCEENEECNVWTYNKYGNCFLKEKNQGEEEMWSHLRRERMSLDR